MQVLKALIQNFEFRIERGLPTVNFVYPDYTADGLTEMFRFDSGLRHQLWERAHRVHDSLGGRQVAHTLSESILLEVDKIVPRLRLGEHIRGKVNVIYPYAPILFVGIGEADFSAFIVRPIVDASMAWFELTQAETDGVRDLLLAKAESKPYRSFLQRVLNVRTTSHRRSTVNG